MKVKSFVSFFILFSLSLLIFFGHVQKVNAAALTWDGGGADNNWSTCANWTTDACPGSADTVTFNNTSTKNSTVDASFTGTITSLTIASGYTGTITLARSLTLSSNFSQAAGTFNGDGQILDINGTYSLTAGVFTGPSTTMSVASTFTISGSPTFNANGGIVSFDGSTTATLSCNNVSFNLVTFAHSGSSNKTVSSNCSLPLGNNPTLGTDNLADVTLSGTLSGTGTLTSGLAAGGNSLILNSGSSLSGFTGLVAGGINFVGSTYNFGSYTIFDINGSFALSSGAVFTAPSGVATFASTFTLNSGTTFNANGGTVTFDGNTSATLSCNNVAFNRVIFSHTGNVTKTVNSDCALPLGNNPTIGSDNSADLTLNGTLSGSGTLTIGTATTGNTLVLNSGSTFSGFSGLVAGSVSIVGASYNFGNYTTFDVLQFTLSSGAVFTAPSGTAYFGSVFTLNAGTTFNANGGTVVFDTTGGVITCNNTVFNLVVFSFPAGTRTVSSDCVLPLGNNPAGIGGNLILNGTLVGTGTLNTSGTGTLTLNSTAVLSGFNGLITNSLVITGATTNFGSYTTFDVNGAFTLNSGSVFTAPSGLATFASTFTLNSGSTFNANGGTVTFDASSAVTINCNNTVFHLVTFAHTGSAITVNSDCNLPLGANPVISRGITLNGTLSGSGTLTVGGVGGGTTTLNTGAILSGFSGLIGGSSTAGGGLNIAGATADFSNYSPFTLSGSLTVSSGTFIAPTGTITIGASFNHTGGTFTHNNGTLIFDGDNHNIIGSTTFYNLTKIGSGTLTFEAGSTQTILGTLTLKGTGEGSRLLLRSSSPGTQWNIDPQGVRLLAYLDVQDSNNINSAVIETGGTGSVDSGNNIGWNFAQNPIAIELLGPGDNNYTNNERPVFTFRANTNPLVSISSYKLDIDNGAWGDIQIDNIPPAPPGSGTSTSDTERDYPKYHIRYEHYEDQDLTNNYINIYTKSSSDWGGEKEHNDGKLKEGKRIWTVTGYSGAGTHALSRVLFVDKTNPIVANILVNNKSVVPDTQLVTYTTDQTPRLEGKVLDSLAAQDDIQSDRVAAGPREIRLSIKRKNILGIYELVPGQKEEIIPFEMLFEEGTGNKLADFSSNTYSKYSWFAHTLSTPLPYGKYQVFLKGVDRAGNSKEYSFLLTVSSSFASSLNLTKTAINDNGEKLTREEATDEAKLEENEEKSLDSVQDKTYEVDVKVTDDAGQAIGGATVTLNSTPRQEKTNDRGIASFKDIERGEHTVTIAYKDQVGEEKVVLGDDVKRYELSVKLQRRNPLLEPQSLAVIGVLLIVILFLVFKVRRNSLSYH